MITTMSIQTAAPPVPTISQYPLPLPSLTESRWYAAYTSARHEKKIATQLARLRVEYFLPLYNTPSVAGKTVASNSNCLSFLTIFCAPSAGRTAPRFLSARRSSLGGIHQFPRTTSASEIMHIRSILEDQFRAEPHP